MALDTLQDDISRHSSGNGPEDFGTVLLVCVHSANRPLAKLGNENARKPCSKSTSIPKVLSAVKVRVLCMAS